MGTLRLRSDALRWRGVDDEIVAVDLQTSTYLSANPTGALLWEALAEGTTREELVRRLVERYALEEEQAGADVDTFLASLDEQGLLERQ